MASETLLAAGVEPVPFAYTVPPAGELELLAVSSKYDGSGAAGDYVPTLIVRNPAGIIQYEVPIGETVAAGDDARVTWAPFLRAPTPGFPGLTSGLLWGQVINQVIPSGVVKDVTLAAWTSAPGSQPPFKLDAFFDPVQPLVLTEFRVWVQLAITWPAGAYDRYIEFDPTGTTDNDGAIHVRARGSVTPDDDIQVIEAVEGENLSVSSLLNMRCFQASGVNKTIQGSFIGYGWPRVKGGFYS